MRTIRMACGALVAVLWMSSGVVNGDLTKAQQSQELEGLLTIQDVISTRFSSDETALSWELRWAYPVSTWNLEELFVTFHRSAPSETWPRQGRVAVYERIGERYRLLLELLGREAAHFGYVRPFHAAGELFLHIPLLYEGTGHVREDTILHVVQGDAFERSPHHQLESVIFEPSTTWFHSQLRPGEAVWKGESSLWTDACLGFEFFIWKTDTDANCCPSAGRVIGTYHVLKEQQFDSQRQRWMSVYRVAVERATRLPISNDEHETSHLCADAREAIPLSVSGWE